MVKKVIQFRYYGEGNAMNWPASADTKANFTSGLLFNDYAPFVHLGVQTLPGTKLWLNNNFTTPVIVGATGIYELALENTTGLIQGIKVDQQSMDIIENTRGGYIIIDLVYEPEED